MMESNHRIKQKVDLEAQNNFTNFFKLFWKIKISSKLRELVGLMWNFLRDIFVDQIVFWLGGGGGNFSFPSP